MEQLIKTTKANNFNELRLRLKPKTHKTIYSIFGQGFESLANQVFESITYEKLYRMNSLNFVEKLYEVFNINYIYARDNKILEVTTSWLETFLEKNLINVKNFLRFLIFFMSTSHLVKENDCDEETYLKEIQNENCEKKGALYLYGRSNSGKSFLQVSKGPLGVPRGPWNEDI